MGDNVEIGVYPLKKAREIAEEQELDLEYNQITVESELKKRGSVKHNLEDRKTSRLNFIFIWGCRPS